MNARPVVTLGFGMILVGVISLGSELLLKTFNAHGLVWGGLRPGRGETPAQLQERSRDQDKLFRERYAKFRPWAVVALVVGVVVMVTGLVI